MFSDAYDMATEAFSDIKRAGGEPIPDQKLMLAQIYSNLSISQELSRMIMDKGLTVRIEDAEPSEPGSPRLRSRNEVTYPSARPIV